MPCLRVLDSNFKKPLSYLQSALWNLCNCKTLHKKKKKKKKKNYKFRTTNTLFGYSWVGIWKRYCHIWNQHPWTCLIAKFREIMKMLKFGTKNAVFAYFWAKILKICCNIWNQHPQIWLNKKFHEKTKNPKLATKNPLFEYFWAGIWKKILSFLKSASLNFSFCKVWCKSKNS